MNVYSALLLLVTTAPAKGFVNAVPRTTRGSSSFDVRIDRINKVPISQTHLGVAATDAAGVRRSDPSSSSNDAVRKLRVGYKWLSKTNYLTLALVQAGILASAADIATQTMENAGKVPIDFAHVAAMATVASTMSGVFNAVCLRQLEGSFPGKTNTNVALKTVIHATIIASIINSAYLAGVPLLADHLYPGAGLPANPLGAWNLPEFITLTKLEVAMFIPYNTLAFAFVPPQVRPLTHAAISATFNVAVSAVTLGYFDAWCDRAIHMFG